MKNATSPCSDDRLHLLLYGEEHEEAYRDAVEHLESCTSCQSRLAVLAADQDEWAEVRRSLAIDEGDQQIEQEQAERSWSVSGHRRPPKTWTDSMIRQLLAPPSHPEMLGRLGRYEIERLIGVGGMGVVFKGFDSELNRPVAIKVLAPHLASSGAARRRFAREARAAAAIVHEHVVAIHNVESDSEPPFLVMQYVAGQSLQFRLDREGPLSVCEVLRIARQTAAGLAAAHQQGLVHRDVKPSNILLEEGVERAVLSDFGLARAGDDASLTQSGHAPGTPNYMSPEQARCEGVDHRSDMFSLGSVMYAMCSGRPPFRAETSYGVLHRITDEPHRPVRQVNPDFPDWLAEIIDRLLAKDPGRRFQSAAEVVEVLGAGLAHVRQPDVVPPPHGQRHAASLTSRRRGQSHFFKLLMGAACACLLALAGVLIVLELNKGTLTIQSEAADVPVRIMQGDKVVEKLTVTRSGASVRVAAGQYIVEIDGEMDGLAVENGTVKLQRRGREIVRIVQEDNVRDSWLWLTDSGIAWGPVAANGLQAGVRFEPRNEQYVVGQWVTPHFYYRNAANENRDLSFPRLMTHSYYGKILAVDAAGKAIPIDQDADAGAPVGWIQLPLGPGTQHEIRGLGIILGDVERDAAETVIRARPGDSVRVHFLLPNYLTENAAPLQTGEVTFSMAHRAGGEQQAAGRISITPDKAPDTIDSHTTPDSANATVPQSVSPDAWGEPTNGLRIAAVANPDSVKLGEVIPFKIIVENTSERVITFSALDLVQGAQAEVRRTNKDQVATSWGRFSSSARDRRYLLQPGQRIVVAEPSLMVVENKDDGEWRPGLTKVILSGGTRLRNEIFLVRYTIKLGDNSPAEGEWVGSLTSGFVAVVASRMSAENNVGVAEPKSDEPDLRGLIQDLEGPDREAEKPDNRAFENLKELGLAFLNYHDVYRRFPPAVITHRGPRKLRYPYSWRVEILPFVNGVELYQQYNFDEPWDSEHNKKLLPQMPPVFCHPEAPVDSTNAAYFALAGPGTAFEGSSGIPILDFPDGPSNTILLVEAKRDIPWTKPEDIPYAPEKVLPKLGGYQENGFNAVFCDGSVRFIPLSTEEWVLRLLIKRNDAQAIPEASFPERIEPLTPRREAANRNRPASRLQPEAAGLPSSVDEGAILELLCQQAYSHATALKSLQYAFEYDSRGFLHAQADFYADETRFRVNRRDVQEPYVSFASAFDGKQHQYRQDRADQEPVFRIRNGNDHASYSISTPQTMMFTWLRLPRDTAFRWDLVFDRNRWERRFNEAIYVGRVREGRQLFEVVEFPQRDVKTPCIYRVFFAPELGYLPIKYERRVEATGERASWLEVVRYKTFDISGRQIAVPLEVEYTGTHADGVSVNKELTITVAKETLKVNEPLDDNLFTISREGVKKRD